MACPKVKICFSLSLPVTFRCKLKPTTSPLSTRLCQSKQSRVCYWQRMASVCVCVCVFRLRQHNTQYCCLANSRPKIKRPNFKLGVCFWCRVWQRGTGLNSFSVQWTMLMYVNTDTSASQDSTPSRTRSICVCRAAGSFVDASGTSAMARTLGGLRVDREKWIGKCSSHHTIQQGAHLSLSFVLTGKHSGSVPRYYCFAELIAFFLSFHPKA